ILQVLVVRAAGEELALPLDAVERTLRLRPEEIHRVHDREILLLPPDEAAGSAEPVQVPLIWLADALGIDGPRALGEEVPVILVNAAGEVYGLAVERLGEKRETVLKSLGALLEQVPCAAGATLIGERVAVILDVVQVVQRGLAAPSVRHFAAPKERP